MPQKQLREVPKEFQKVQRSVTIKPKTLDKDKRTFEIIWTTGAEVFRQGWFSDYYEKLSMKSESVRMGRLNNGAPFLKMHRVHDLDSVIGVVESAELVGEEGRATIRLSDRPEVDGILRDIENGILRNISVGYSIYSYEKVEERDNVPVYEITDWEPFELSLVTSGADDSAKIRSLSIDNNPISEKDNKDFKNINQKRENSMPQSEVQVDLEKVKKDTIEAERKRQNDIREACKKARCSEEFTNQMLTGELSVDEVRAKIIDEVFKREQETQKEINAASISVGVDKSKEGRVLGMTNAILNRANPEKYKVDEQSRNFANLSLLEMAREICVVNGVSVAGKTRNEIATRALATSDFPEILANVMGKSLRDSYSEAPQTFRPFTRQVYVKDFKEISRTQLGEAPNLELIPEHGAVKKGSLSELAEKYFVKTYGKKLAFTRKHIINDDLDMVSRIPSSMGGAASRLESNLAYEILVSNPTMADGVALFHANHGNLGVAAAISIASVGLGRAAMRKQKGLDKLAPLNLAPSTLLVPADLETIAEQFCVQNIQPVQDSTTNPFKGRLQPISEARLTDATAWYLIASLAQIDLMEIAYLEGSTGPMLETRQLGGAEGVEMEVLHDVGMKVIDWRGFYKNPGA